MKYKWRLLFCLVIAVTLICFLAMDASAQCSMCRAALTGSNNGRFLRNFNIGVLVLLLPPVSIFCSIFIVLRRHRGDASEKTEALDPEVDR
jgi:hypothetical protein